MLFVIWAVLAGGCITSIEWLVGCVTGDVGGGGGDGESTDMTASMKRNNMIIFRDKDISRLFHFY